MKEKDFLTFYEKKSESIVPTSVVVSRDIGQLTVQFPIQGYLGEETGEIYYSRDTAIAIENVLELRENERSGLVVSHRIPQYIFSDAETDKDPGHQGFSFGTAPLNLAFSGFST
jgi:hypothetical protein